MINKNPTLIFIIIDKTLIYIIITEEMDDLKNKRISCLGKLLQIQINIALNNKKNAILEKIREIENRKKHIIKQEITENLRRNDILTEQLKKFFATNPLSQIMEEKNAIAETTQKRRITCLGIGGIKNSQTNLTIREIHPSQYGRICPIETSEGKNAGLVLSFVNEYNLNSEGFLNTPFYM